MAVDDVYSRPVDEGMGKAALCRVDRIVPVITPVKGKHRHVSRFLVGADRISDLLKHFV